MAKPIAPFMSAGALCVHTDSFTKHPDIRLVRIELTPRDKIRLIRELAADVETQCTD